MSAPERLLDMLKLHHQFARRLALQILHQLAGRHIRRARHQQMHMVLRHMSRQNFDLVRLAYLDDQRPQPMPNLAIKHGLAVLCHPHEVVFDIEAAVRTGTVIFHPPILPAADVILKASPEGEGFRPIVRQ